MWCDGKGDTINNIYVQLRQNYTMAQAKSDAVVTWDNAERRRIRDHNIRWAVYWARARLIGRTTDTIPENVGRDKIRPTRSPFIVEDHSKSVPLHTCAMVLGEIMNLAHDVLAVKWLRGKSWYAVDTAEGKSVGPYGMES
jgi:hypothetical protein